MNELTLLFYDWRFCFMVAVAVTILLTFAWANLYTVMEVAAMKVGDFHRYVLPPVPRKEEPMIDYTQLYDVECDGCCRLLGGGLTAEEYHALRAEGLVLCHTCLPVFCDSIRLDNVGMRVLAAQCRRQTIIYSTLSDVEKLEVEEAVDDLPF